MMKKRIAATIMAGFVVCSIAGCSTKAATETAKETTQTETAVTKSEETTAKTDTGVKKKYVIGLAMNTQTNPFFCGCKGWGTKSC
jgi:ribose transport system substrate-binding protein